MALNPGPSLRARLVASALLASTLAAGVLIVGLQVLLANSNDAAVESALRAQTEAGAATVVTGPDGAQVLESTQAAIDQNLWVYDARGRLIDGRRPTGELATAVPGLVGSTTSSATTQTHRVRAVPVRGPSGAVIATVVAAANLTPYENAEAHSLWLSLVLGLLTVAAASASAWAAATQSLRQVRTMSARADDWREHDLSQRFALGDRGDELTQLGNTLDRMLDRIGEALLGERRLTDEIAHELRTPLTVIRGEAELALEDPSLPESARSGLTSVLAASDRMRSAIDTMLTVARAQTTAPAHCTVAEVCAGVERPAPPTESSDRLAAPLPIVVASLRPLLENAHQHGGGDGRLEVRIEDRHVVFAVLDDGPGVRAEDAERVFEAGWTTGGSAGLGLGLSRRMAHTVGGQVSAVPGTGGRFELAVPRA